MLVGALLWQAVLVGSGFKLVDRETVRNQEMELAALRKENDELFEDLFSPQIAASYIEEHGELPYDEQADAGQEVANARLEALEAQKFLMVTFGANWCLDCRTLSRILKGDELSEYTNERFHFVNVDVGKFNRNISIAAELGVSLERGIPVAVFIDSNGAIIGTTNNGELEPSRRYTSKQILKFVRDIAERSLILAPDAIE